MGTTTTANMLLTVPGVGTEAGPAYASEINADLALIDTHDHSTNKGVQITPAGLNINSNLAFGGNNAITVRSVRFSAQSSPLTSSASSDLVCVYAAGVDLYYNDGNGNQVRLTSGGGVAGSPGSITNLASPAIANWNLASSTFVWQSAANVAANLDARNVILRNSTVSSKGLTLSPPASMVADITQTFPAIPGSTSYMTMDSSGNMGTSPITNQVPLSVKSKTANYTVAANDGLILCDVSGGAFALTLYTAVGNAGTQVLIKKTSSDFTALTIATTGSQTIDAGSAPFTTSLNTINEEVTLVSDGTNWQTVSRRIPSAWVAATFGVTGGLAASGLSGQSSFIKRVGDSLQCKVQLVLGNTSAATGTITLPSGISLDTSKFGNSVVQMGTWFGERLGNSYSVSPGRVGPVGATTGDASSVYLSAVGTAGSPTSISAINSYLGGGDGLTLDMTIPVLGWNG